MKILIEIIFEGKNDRVNRSLLNFLIANSEGVRLNYPDIDVGELEFDGINHLLNEQTNIDVMFESFFLPIDEIKIPHVFANLGLEEGKVDLLLFFDIDDLNLPDRDSAFQVLGEWCKRFKSDYHFDSFLCQFDNGNELEYYFNDSGWGPLYYSQIHGEKK